MGTSGLNGGSISKARSQGNFRALRENGSRSKEKTVQAKLVILVWRRNLQRMSPSEWFLRREAISELFRDPSPPCRSSWTLFDCCHFATDQSMPRSECVVRT